MGEGAQEQAPQEQAPWLAQHWGHVAHGLFETCVTSPVRPPSPHPAESQPWAGELGAHSFPTTSFISWRSIWCVPSPTENLLVIEARVWWDSSANVSCPFLTFTTLDGQKRIPKTLGAWQVHPQGQREGCSGQRKHVVGAGGSASPVEVSVAQSSQGRAPGRGGIRVQLRRRHRIWRGERRLCLRACSEKQTCVLWGWSAVLPPPFRLLTKSPGRPWEAAPPPAPQHGGVKGVKEQDRGALVAVVWVPEGPSPAWRSRWCHLQGPVPSLQPWRPRASAGQPVGSRSHRHWGGAKPGPLSPSPHPGLARAVPVLSGNGF